MAVAQYAAALALAVEIGDLYEQARGHHGLSRTYRLTGDLDQARHHRHQALTIYTDLDVVDDNTADLTALDQLPGRKDRGS